MLKSHLQPIVAYFNTTANQQLSQKSSARQDLEQGLLQSAVDYYAGASDKRLGAPAQQDDRSQHTTWLQRLWHRLITINPDPRIKQRVARDGQSYWYAYDPTTDQSHTFFSEEEVYQWLERRYYQ